MTDEANAGGNEGGGEGTVETPAWMNSMPDAYKQNEGFAKFGEAADAYAKFDELLQAEGSALKIPGENATDEDRDAFYSQMGRPDTPEGYEIGKPENLPEGMPYSDDLEAGYRAMAHEKGISNKDAAAIFNWHNEVMAKAYADNAQAEKSARDKATNELKDLWKGDEFKVNTALAERAFLKYAGDDGAKFFEDTKVNGTDLGNHPIFLKIFAEIGKTISDDSANTGRLGVGAVKSEEQKAKDRFPNTKWQ